MLDFDNTFGTITAYCDEKECDNDETFEGFDGHCDLQGTIKEMKENGWEISRKDGDWFHSCPNHRDNN